jgi:hypothetical protein
VIVCGVIAIVVLALLVRVTGIRVYALTRHGRRMLADHASRRI